MLQSYSWWEVTYHQRVEWDIALCALLFFKHAVAVRHLLGLGHARYGTGKVMGSHFLNQISHC